MKVFLIRIYFSILALSLPTCFSNTLRTKVSHGARHSMRTPRHLPTLRNPRRAVGVIYAKQQNSRENDGQIIKKDIGTGLRWESILKDAGQSVAQRLAKSSPPNANPTYFHGYQKWKFRPNSDTLLEIWEDRFPNVIQFYLCHSVFFDQNPFRTPQEIEANCRRIRTYIRNWFDILFGLLSGDSYGYANIPFEGRDLENYLPTDDSFSAIFNSYRIVAVFAKDDGREVHIYPSPEIFLHWENEKLVLKPAKSKTELINFSLLADRLRDFHSDGNHRLSYELKGTEGAEAIQKMLPYVQVHKSTLLEACRSRDVAAVRVLLENGADLNAKNDSYTPMHFCCQKGITEIIPILMEFGYDINQRVTNSKSPLQTAVVYNQLEAVKFLIGKGAEIDYRDFQSQTALYCAASAGTHKILEYLLEAGAEVDAQSQFGMTPLLIAVERGDVKNVRSLLNRKASIRYRNKQGKNALFLACERGSADVVEELLTHRAPVDERGPDEYTPLMIAAEIGSVKTVELLISYGADMNAVNNQGETALIISALKSNRNDAGIILAERGASLDVQDGKGNTAFIYAISLGFTQLASVLMDHGANVNLRNAMEETALFAAIRSGRWESIQLCLSHGVEIDHLNHAGKSALTVARELANPDIYRMILAYLSLMKLSDDNQK